MIGASGHGWALAVFPLLAALIASAFGLRLSQRFLRARRPFEGVWAISLFMFAAASIAALVGLARGWTPGAYRVYWLLGAVLNVPYLAQGELYLLLGNRRRAAHLGFFVLLAASVFAAAVTWTGTLRAAQLEKALPLGKDVWAGGAPYQLRWLSWIGFVGLIGGIVWSARGMRQYPGLRDRAIGTLVIAGGASVVAIGSGVGAGFDVVPVFFVGLAAGIAIMFWGFLMAGRSSRAPAPSP